MPRFIVNEASVARVTWSREIEVPTMEDAIAFVRDSDGERSGCREIMSPESMEPIVGDNLEGFEPTYTAEELGPEECL